VSGAAQAPPVQHCCPLPPQVPQLPLPHSAPGPHAMHCAPPIPQTSSLVPGSQALLAQQPAHEVASQVQMPLTQRWPVGHAPPAQTPPQPSSAPQGLPVQAGVHPQTPDSAPPPQASGAVQAAGAAGPQQG
jgi:hypothetical protein